MEAGKLNRRITIQRKTVTPDSYNQPIETWVDAFTVWCRVVSSGGKEYYAAQKLNASTEIVFSIRYTTEVTPTDRIKYGTRIFEILSVNDVDGMREELRVSTKEVV